MKIGTLFTGVGAWEKALIDLEIPFDLKFFCEFDKYAIQSYCAMYGESNDLNLGDITKVDTSRIDDVDIIFYSPPCQAFSVAGKQLGFEDKRGVLFYDALKIIAAKKPKVAIMENVKGLTGKKFKVEFEDMLKSLEDLGYTNSYKVLNAKDYEIPQNRERVFIVSILDGQEFEFPEGVELKLRLKDMLEDVVDEKYYVSEEKTREFFNNNPDVLEKLGKYFETSYCIDANYWKGTTLDGFFNKKRRQLVLEPNVKQIGNLVKTKNRDNPNRGRIYDVNAIGPALNCMQGGGLQPYVIIPGRIVGRRLNELGKRDDYNKDIDIKQRFEINENDNYINTLTTVQKDNMILIDDTKSKRFGGGKIWKDIAPCLRSSRFGHKIVNLSSFRIRRLSPTECWRLQGFKDEDIQKCIDAGVSNSQLYKQAGNSICVNVPKAILNKLIKEVSF